MKYLIAGLGNIGEEYKFTRHNIGFQILDAFITAENASLKDKIAAKKKRKTILDIFRLNNLSFKSGRYAAKVEVTLKNKQLILIKPSTYVNRSGDAVRYWLQNEKVPIENLLVIVDDISLSFGVVRLRAGGGDGGHNGLKDINETLQTNDYARLRFGIGSNFPKGRQVDYVLGQWADEESEILFSKINTAIDAIKSFVTEGIQKTMTVYNR